MQKLLSVFALAAGLSFAAHASTDCKEDKPGLRQQAKITCAQAKAAALRHAGKGKIVKSEIEKDKGKVVYSISIDDGAKDDLVEVKIDAFSGATLHGKVESLSGGTGARFSLLPPDNASGNYVKVVQRVPVRIAFAPDEDVHDLRAGMSVTVDIDTGRQNTVWSSLGLSSKAAEPRR